MQREGAIGIDIGSTTFKVVVINQKKEIIFSNICSTEADISSQIERIFESDLSKYRDFAIVSTGYGKELVKKATHKFTEITCHLNGVYEEFHRGCTIVDIGGQDSKVIKCSEKGELIDFVMNDKCSAGTGRFIENISTRFKIPIERIGRIALSTETSQNISSTCTVFAESEIISLLSQGSRLEEILRGVHLSLVRRIKSMIKSIGFEPPLIMSGGVALNPAIVQLMGKELGTEPVISRHPQLTAAFGAAILGIK